MHAKVASCARLCKCLLLSMYQALSVCAQRRDAYWLCGAILRSLPHEKRANKEQLKLSERIPALPAHSLDEVKDIGFWIVFMNSWPLRSGQKVLT